MDDLIKALDNESNKYIMELSFSKIKQEKNDILQQIQLKGEKLKLYHNKLKNYRYISDISYIVIGSYIRWINLNKFDINEKNCLTNGAIVCDWRVFNSGLHVICKNNYGKIIQINFDENLIFQKINDQENILLNVLNYINN